MSKPKKPQPAAPPPPAATSNISERSETTLRLEPDAKLNVTVLTPDKPVQPLSRNLRLFIAACIVLLAAWVPISWFFVMDTRETNPIIEFREASLTISVTYPAYATFKDELEVAMNIANRGTEEFTGNVTLLFQGAPAYPLPAESATAKLDKLAVGAGHSHRLKFALRQSPRWFSSQTIQTELSAQKGDRTFPTIKGPSIAVAWHTFPLRTINTWLGNSVVLGVIAALLWEIARKRLFGWEAK